MSDRRRTISGTAAAAASLFTVTRTSCDPAAASAAVCATVSSTSAVSVFVIDWTTIGCALPTGTSPMVVVTVRRRGAKGMLKDKDDEAIVHARAGNPDRNGVDYVCRSDLRAAILDDGVHMMDDLDQPPRAYTTADVASQPEPTRKRMGWRGEAGAFDRDRARGRCARIRGVRLDRSALHVLVRRPCRIRTEVFEEGMAVQDVGRARSRWRISREHSRRSSTSPCATIRSRASITKSMGQRVDITLRSASGRADALFWRDGVLRHGSSAGIAMKRNSSLGGLSGS